MPETSPNLNCYPEPAKHDIRLAGKVFLMESKSIPQAMECAADLQLWAGVLGSDSPHDFGALCTIEDIRHAYTPSVFLIDSAILIANRTGTASLTSLIWADMFPVRR